MCFLKIEFYGNQLPIVGYHFYLCYTYLSSLLHVEKIHGALHQQSHLQFFPLTEELCPALLSVDGMRKMEAQFADVKKTEKKKKRRRAQFVKITVL